MQQPLILEKEPRTDFSIVQDISCMDAATIWKKIDENTAGLFEFMQLKKHLLQTEHSDACIALSGNNTQTIEKIDQLMLQH